MSRARVCLLSFGFLFFADCFDQRKASRAERSAEIFAAESFYRRESGAGFRELSDVCCIHAVFVGFPMG